MGSFGNITKPVSLFSLRLVTVVCRYPEFLSSYRYVLHAASHQPKQSLARPATWPRTPRCTVKTDAETNKNYGFVKFSTQARRDLRANGQTGPPGFPGLVEVRETGACRTPDDSLAEIKHRDQAAAA